MIVETFYVIWDDAEEAILTHGKTRFHIKRANCQKKVDRINAWSTRLKTGHKVSVRQVNVVLVTPE